MQREIYLRRISENGTAERKGRVGSDLSAFITLSDAHSRPGSPEEGAVYNSLALAD